MATIAGHTFTDTPQGKRVCVCGRAWIDVAPATRADIGKAGWAHSGALTEGEYQQIDQERERVWLLGIGKAIA